MNVVATKKKKIVMITNLASAFFFNYYDVMNVALNEKKIFFLWSRRSARNAEMKLYIFVMIKG